MKRNLGPLSLLTAVLVLLPSIPVFPQQVASVTRVSSKNEASAAAPAAAEEMRAEISRLQSRKAALQKYIVTVDPASADFLTTARYVREVDAKLKELNESLQALVPAKKLTLAAGARMGKYKTEVKLRIDPSYSGDIRLAVVDRLGNEVFNRTISNLVRGVNNYTTDVNLVDGENIIAAASFDDSETSNSLVILGGNAAPDPAPVTRVASTTAQGSLQRSDKIEVQGDPEVHGRKADVQVRVARSISGIRVEVRDSSNSNRVDRAKTFRLSRDQDVITLEDLALVAEHNIIKISSLDGKAVTEVEADSGMLAPVSVEDSDTGHLVGLLLGGVVISQQAGKFSQADPFFGFTAGYSGELHGGVLHGRFQGIFQSEAKKDEAPARDIVAPDPTDFKPFLASRKAFNIEGDLWYDVPFNRSQHVFIGPYFGWGASTYMDKNELLGDEGVSVPNKDIGASATPTPTPTPGGAGSDTTELDTSRAKIDNDLNAYKDIGFVVNIFADGRGSRGERPSKLFLQSIFAYGKYEGLAGLYNGGKDAGFWKDSSNRFVGKLRIFPSFLLGSNPDSQESFMPMFGVELNAGRGPDQLKFFTGVAIPLSKFKKLGFAGSGSGND